MSDEKNDGGRSPAPASRLDLLSRVDVLQGLDPADLDVLAEAATEETFFPPAFVFQQNDPPAAFYVIKRGLVRIVRGSSVLAELHEGAVFGEMGVLDDKPRGAAAQAGAFTVLLTIPREALNRVIAGRRSVEMRIRRKILERHAANISTTFHRS